MFRRVIHIALIVSLLGKKGVVFRPHFGVTFVERGMIDPISDKLRIELHFPYLEIFESAESIQACQTEDMRENDELFTLCGSFNEFLETSSQVNEMIVQQLAIVYKLQREAGLSVNETFLQEN